MTPDDVQDVIAETFLTAWRRLDDLPDDPLPWLLGTARRHISNRRRSTRRWRALAVRVATVPPVSPTEEGPRDVDEALRDSIRALPHAEREAFMLVAWDGLDIPRAALVAGCSTATFRVRLHRARMRLKKEVSRLDAEEGPFRTTTHQMEEAR